MVEVLGWGGGWPQSRSHMRFLPLALLKGPPHPQPGRGRRANALPPPLPHINDDSNIVCTPMGASTGRLGVCGCVGRRVCVCFPSLPYGNCPHVPCVGRGQTQPNRPHRHPRSTARSCFALLKERHCSTHPLWGRASERWAWVPARGVGRPMPAVDSMLNRQGKGKCCL